MEILDHIPDGWKAVPDAPAIPKGFVMVTNGKSRFSKDYKCAMIPEEKVKGAAENERNKSR